MLSHLFASADPRFLLIKYRPRWNGRKHTDKTKKKIPKSSIQGNVCA